MGKSGVEVIVPDGTKWLNVKHMKSGLDHVNVQPIARKYLSKYRKHRYELVDEPKKTTNQNFLYENLAIKIIMNYRTESRDFRTDLGFNVLDVFDLKIKQ